MSRIKGLFESSEEVSSEEPIAKEPIAKEPIERESVAEISPLEKGIVYYVRAEEIGFDDNYDFIIPTAPPLEMLMESEEGYEEGAEEGDEEGDFITAEEGEGADELPPLMTPEPGMEEEEEWVLIELTHDQMTEDEQKEFERIDSKLKALLKRINPNWDDILDILLEPVRFVYFALGLQKDKHVILEALEKFKTKLLSLGKKISDIEWDKIKKKLLNGLKYIIFPFILGKSKLQQLLQKAKISKAKRDEFKAKLKEAMRNVGDFLGKIFTTIGEFVETVGWAIGVLSKEAYKNLKEALNNIDLSKLKITLSSPDFTKLKAALDSLRKSIEKALNKVFKEPEWDELMKKILKEVIDVVETGKTKLKEAKREYLSWRERRELQKVQGEMQDVSQNLGLITRTGTSISLKPIETSLSTSAPTPTFDVIEVIAPTNINIIYKDEKNQAFKPTKNTARIYKFLEGKNIGDTIIYKSPPPKDEVSVYIKIAKSDINEWVRINVPEVGRTPSDETIGAYIYLKGIGKIVLPNWSIPVTKYE